MIARESLGDVTGDSQGESGGINSLRTEMKQTLAIEPWSCNR